MAVLNDDVNQFGIGFLDSSANEIIQSMVTVIAIGAATSTIVAPRRGAWMAVLPMPFIVYRLRSLPKRLEPLYAKVREQKLAGSDTAVVQQFGWHCHRRQEFYSRKHTKSAVANPQHCLRETPIATPLPTGSAFTPLIPHGHRHRFYRHGRSADNLSLRGGLAVGVSAGTMISHDAKRLLWPLTRLGRPRPLPTGDGIDRTHFRRDRHADSHRRRCAIAAGRAGAR